MWKYLLITLLIFGLSVNTTRAETTLQEFLDAAPDIITFGIDRYGPLAGNFVVELLADEFLLRYGDSASWDELLTAFQVLDTGYGGMFGTWHHYLNIRPWNQHIVTRWLEQHPTDFATQTEIIFEPYTLTVEPHDFDGDGIDDWFIQAYLSDGDRAINDLWIARRDITQTSGYQIYALPIPYEEAFQSSTFYEGQGATLSYIGDANANGTLEMVFSSWARLPGSWTHASNKRIYIVSWVGDRFASIGGADTNATSYDWEFINVDNDSLNEIVFTYFYDDNWGCQRTEIHIHDWDGERYSQIHETNEFAPTVYCELRQAEDLIRQDNFVDAIPFYESALERFDALTGEERDSAAPSAAFAQERLILAYAFVGRMEKALALLDELRTPPPPDESIAAALVAIPVDELDAERMCRAAYDLMESISNYNRSGPSQHYRGAVIVGFTDEIWYGDNMQIAYWDGNAGCNVDGMQRSRISGAQYPINQPPSEVIESLGLAVDATLTLDLNGDGVGDWLVWTSAFNLNGALAFIAQGDTYAAPLLISFPLYALDGGHSVTLPNGAQAWIRGVSGATNQLCQMESGEDVIGSANTYSLFQFDGEIMRFRSFSLCSDAPLVWQPAGQIEIWQYIQMQGAEPSYDLAALVWDAGQGVYEIKAPSPPYFIDLERSDEAYDLLYVDRQFADALASAAQLLQQQETIEVTYYRAVALDMLGRAGEAQTAYQRVIELDTNSVYGSLASLWLDE